MRIVYPEAMPSSEIEISESGTMLDNRSKFSDLKFMLEGNRENIKMDAMKRIINMIARGKDVSELFPSVVKNVASKNLELKKLVYVYLVRYAEEQQDLSLLSVSTFQRALKDPNQLIRASALRVLSSIRVPMIATVLLLALKDSIRDMSPYVRKVAAHAIPKLHSLDSDLHAQLLECIDYLLGDKRTLVLGSVVYAFEQICPHRLDLLHRHFRPLCRALADVDEWGQILMIGLLTRYARTYFSSPISPEGKELTLDPDHNLLIRSVKPLLQSRNCAVVMAVSQLLFYIAPPSQHSLIPRSLVRLLRGPSEVQYIVLVNISSMCAFSQKNITNNISNIDSSTKNLFEPFLKYFFIRGTDTISVKKLKLHIITNFVSETNVQLVLRELKAYLQMADLATFAIEAIGRCAYQVSSASESCLTCLINVIGSSREQLVCTAVVVLKDLLHSEAPPSLLQRLICLIDTVKAPSARASLLWLVSEHTASICKLGPDLLRTVVKTFSNEDECVKLQALNLAIKLWATIESNRQGKCRLLINYVLQLARYDHSYDVRDRCRFLRNFISDADENGMKTNFPLEIFLSRKPTPALQNKYERDSFQLGTLSHLLNRKCNGYKDLSEFLQQASDESSAQRNAWPLREDELLSSEITSERKKEQISSSSSEQAEEEDIRDNDEALDDEKEQSGKEEEDEVEENEEQESENDDEEEQECSTSASEDDDSTRSLNDGMTSTLCSSDPPNRLLSNLTEHLSKRQQQPSSCQQKDGPSHHGSEKKSQTTPDSNNASKQSSIMATKPQHPNKKDVSHMSDLDLLLDLNFEPTISAPIDTSDQPAVTQFPRVSSLFFPDKFFTLLSPFQSNGITIEGQFSRSPSLFSNRMVSIELVVWRKSFSQEPIDFDLFPSKESDAFHASGLIKLSKLQPEERRRIKIGVDFGDGGRVSNWTIQLAKDKSANFQLQAPFCEQIEAIDLNSNQYSEQKAQLSGMNQVLRTFSKPIKKLLPRDVYRICNCRQVSGLYWSFAAQTISGKKIVLISVNTEPSQWQLIVNCENVTFGSILCEEIEKALVENNFV